MVDQKKLRIADMLALSKDTEIVPAVVDDEGFVVSPAKTITVRPLSLANIIALLDKHRDAFVALYAEGQKEKPDYSVFVVGAEELVADIIARATGRLDEYEDILALPGTVKISLLADIWMLSVPNPKKLAEAVRTVADQLARLQKDMPQMRNDSATVSEA
jgi:hypothetical protein